MTEEFVRIGELAARAGVSTRTVDYYTSLGLITPAQRTAANYRLYDPAEVERIGTIRQLESQGVSLDEIAVALHSRSVDIPAILNRLDDDLQALHQAALTVGPEAQGVLAAVAARTHSLVATALQIVSSMPPV